MLEWARVYCLLFRLPAHDLPLEFRGPHRWQWWRTVFHSIFHQKQFSFDTTCNCPTGIDAAVELEQIRTAFFRSFFSRFLPKHELRKRKSAQAGMSKCDCVEVTRTRLAAPTLGESPRRKLGLTLVRHFYGSTLLLDVDRTR